MLPIHKAGLPAPIIMWLSGFAIITTIGITMVPLTAKYFEFITPSYSDLGLILGLAVVYLLVTEVVKKPVAKFLKMT
jgi:Mg2+-importing ATPase